MPKRLPNSRTIRRLARAPAIIVRSVIQEKLGRFVIVIDELAQTVHVKTLDGVSPSRWEMNNIEKFLRYKRPDILLTPGTARHEREVNTGWGIESAIDLPIGRANTGQKM